MFEKCINGLMQMADNDDDKMLNYGELMPLILGKEPDKKQVMKMVFKTLTLTAVDSFQRR